jgi:putative transposase
VPRRIRTPLAASGDQRARFRVRAPQNSRSLRSQFVFPTVRNAISRTNRRWRDRFRIVHFSVQADHLHFLVEARDARALSGGMRGFSVSFARVFNRLVFRRGCVFPDRWHGRALKTPRAVRHALVYVLANARKHGEAVGLLDALSSAPYFRGFREFCGRVPFPLQPGLVPRFARMCSGEAEEFGLLEEPRSWLLRTGWQRRGLLSVHEMPQ